MINKIGKQFFIELKNGKYIDINDATCAERIAYYNGLTKAEVMYLLEQLGGFDLKK